MLRNVFGRSHIRQFQSAHPRRVRFLSDMEIITRAVSIRAPVRGAMRSLLRYFAGASVSIRAPVRGAIAIRLFRVTPLHSANKIDEFYGICSHSRILATVLLERKRADFIFTRGSHSNSFGLSHSFVSRLQNFGRPAKRPYFGLPRHLTKRRFNLTRQSTTSPTFPLVYHQNFIYKEYSTF